MPMMRVSLEYFALVVIDRIEFSRTKPLPGEANDLVHLNIRGVDEPDIVPQVLIDPHKVSKGVCGDIRRND